MKTWQHLSDLRELVGTLLGSSEWIEIDQARIDRFAAATDDHQWIHVDPERAAAGPFGGTIAHGFLTLSLLPLFFESTYAIADSAMGVNYGLNKVRFTSPVPVGSRLRAHMTLESFDDIDGGAQMQFDIVVEREGQQRPVCVAQAIVRRYIG
jgi:acyl dehydratase